MSKYQIYALDEHEHLLHAGVHEINGKPSPLKCRRIEAAWRKWRREHLAANPGNYPLREHHNKALTYHVHLSGKPETLQIITLGEVNT